MNKNTGVYMRKLIIFASFFALTACAGQYTYQAQQQINSMAQAEANAWKRVIQLNQEQCPKGSPEKPLPKSKVMEANDCWARIVNANVAPVAMAPDLLNQLILSNKQIALSYKKGKIDKDEVSLESDKAWAKYIAAVDARSRNAVMQANQQDQALAQQRQQYFQNLSQQVQQQEIQQQQDAPAFRNTNCYASGNHMDCTTW